MKRGKADVQSAISEKQSSSQECVFCEVANSRVNSIRVFENEDMLAFLDHRPLFPGHCLLITKKHIRTLGDLPPSLVETVFLNVRMLALAVQSAIEAAGTLIAINNVVSQSVPHFHVHVVPRRKGDGLRGFMWPRQKYETPEKAEAVGNAIREEIVRLGSGTK